MVGNLEISLIFSLFSLGLSGGFGHCGFMCGPFVLMQVNNRLKDIKIEKITHLQKLQGLALIPYHLGRMTTYSFLGLMCAILGKNIRYTANAHIVSAVMLIIAAAIILNLILKNFNINLSFGILKKKVKFLNKLKLISKKLLGKKYIFQNKSYHNLFKNPKGFDGYVLGIILGFIPCGLLYSALIIASTFDNYFLAAFGMFLFAIGTVPPLFISAIGGYLFFNKLKIGFKLFTQFILLINMIMLIIMAFSQLT